MGLPHFRFGLNQSWVAFWRHFGLAFDPTGWLALSEALRHDQQMLGDDFAAVEGCIRWAILTLAEEVSPEYQLELKRLDVSTVELLARFKQDHPELAERVLDMAEEHQN